MPSILDNTWEVVDDWFRPPSFGKFPHFQHKSSLQAMAKEQRILNAAVLLRKLLKTVEENWRAYKPYYSKPPSSENWRFTKREDHHQDNPSAETRLERAIVRINDDNWANQIPTSAGLVDPYADNNRHIDLSERQKHAYSFNELKVVSTDTPAKSALQILRYGVLYLFSRAHLDELGYAGNPLFETSHLRLCVLAPYAYYLDFDGLRWLESVIASGLTRYFDERQQNDFSMSFQFDCFPRGFDWPCDDEELRTALENRISLRDYERAL